MTMSGSYNQVTIVRVLNLNHHHVAIPGGGTEDMFTELERLERFTLGSYATQNERHGLPHPSPFTLPKTSYT